MFFIGFYINSQLKTPTNQNTITKICHKENCFNIELAETKEKREMGLMYREVLAEDHGMLFLFEREGNYPFWMKNTLLSLDIIWINSNKTVVYIDKAATPCMKDPCTVYNPKTNAKYVLELNANTTNKIELNVGDKLEFK